MALPRRRVSTCCGCGLGVAAAAEPMASANFFELMLAALPREAMPALRVNPDEVVVLPRKGLGGVSCSVWCGVSPPSPPPPPPPPPRLARRRLAQGVSPMLAESCHNGG